MLLVLSAWSMEPPAAHAPDDPHVRIAAVQYGGGGDWYQAETPLPTFLSFVREHTASMLRLMAMSLSLVPTGCIRIRFW